MMMPPLTTDRGALVRARVKKLMLEISLSQTTMSVRRAVFRAEGDEEIDDEAKAELVSHAMWRMGNIRASKSGRPLLAKGSVVPRPRREGE